MKIRALFLIFALFLLSGCVRHSADPNIRPSAVPGKRITKTAVPPQISARSAIDPDSDPWETCEAETDSDPVLLRVADLVPEEYRRRVQISFMIQNDAADSALIAQRCMNGRVYVCHAEEGKNCHDRLDFSTIPNEMMEAVCAYPELEGGTLPAAVVDRNSAYQWVCHDGQPLIAGAAEPDRAGYDSAIWTEIPKPE